MSAQALSQDVNFPSALPGVINIWSDLMKSRKRLRDRNLLSRKIRRREALGLHAALSGLLGMTEAAAGIAIEPEKTGTAAVLGAVLNRQVIELRAAKMRAKLLAIDAGVAPTGVEG